MEPVRRDFSAESSFFQIIIDTIPTPIFYKDTHGRYLGCNEAFAKHIGFPKEMIIGKTPWELVPKEVADEYERRDRALIEAQKPQIIETAAFYADGIAREVIINKNVFYNPDGTVGGVAGVILDISKRKQAEKSLQQQEELLREQLSYANALNQIAETIITNDETQVILESMTQIIGQTLCLDRTLINSVNFSSNIAIGLCEWDNPNDSTVYPTKSNWNLDMFNNSMEYVREKMTWLESHIDDLNPLLVEDNVTDLLHHRMGAKSILYYPFSFQSDNFYLLTLHQTKSQRKWREEEIHFIEAAAKQVEIAIQKINYLEEQKRSERTIWEEKERAQVTLESIGDAVITTDSEGRVEYLNPVAESLTGWKNAEAVGLPLLDVFNIINEKTQKAVKNPVTECLREGRIVGLANHTVLIHKEGRRFAIEDSASPIRNRENEVIGAVLVFHDVTEKRNILEQMTYQAYHDSLTGLPNRILFNDRLTLALAQAHRAKEKLAVMFFDLDKFKQVNDIKGHAQGDKMLKDIADRVAGCIRESDTIARLGGDEFALLLPHIKCEEDAAKVAEKVLLALEQPWNIDEQEFLITASIGIAVYPNDGENAETVIRNADTAMYRAKEHGRNNYQLYTSAMNIRIMERLNMENSLRHALKRGEFDLYYQPKLNALTEEITGMEALIRWNHPERGLLLPYEFISVAEETKMIIPIGEWVLQAACSQNKAWQDWGLAPKRVSVNLSAYQFSQHDLVDVVKRALNSTGLDPKWLELEITESALMKDVKFTEKTLRELKDMGIYISIDDFGKGFSSLNYLKNFPIDALKIDRSFVKDISSDPQDKAIVSTIIVLAKNLNLGVIAEGVETREHLIILKQLECTEVQGFLFSKPVPGEEFSKRLSGCDYSWVSCK